jgi:hypothetical protein
MTMFIHISLQNSSPAKYCRLVQSKRSRARKQLFVDEAAAVIFDTKPWYLCSKHHLKSGAAIHRCLMVLAEQKGIADLFEEW